MAKARYMMIGGFLGSGKTTAILKLAEYLRTKGLRPAVITNDQSVDLVDTARARAAGFAVEEITGGCFCCKFDALVSASQRLGRTAVPDALIAEPVGSCTDLQATVSYPLRQLYGDHYRVSPLSVLVDPLLYANVLGQQGAHRFSDKVAYVYLKQLEEAEVLVVNKIDLLDGPARQRLRGALAERFPQAQVMLVSCHSGEGLEPWFERIAAGDLGRRPAMDVDYDAYADGEACLGWLNASFRVAGLSETRVNELLTDLATRLKDRLAEQQVEIAHLKLSLASTEGPEVGAVSLTWTKGEPAVSRPCRGRMSNGQLVVNLRAEADPELLQHEVAAAVGSLSPLKPEPRLMAAFRPGRPVPTHRITTPAAP